MKILVIPEDPTLDQFILKPVVERVLSDLGVAARVEILRDPHLSGIDMALNVNIVKNIIDENPMIDVFILAVDRDCDRVSNERRAQAIVEHHRERLVACLAKEELEVWMLALFNDHSVGWNVIRDECDPKERFAEGFLQERGWSAEVGKGRKRAMREISGNWQRLLSRCPEVAQLRNDVRQLLQSPN